MYHRICRCLALVSVSVLSTLQGMAAAPTGRDAGSGSSVPPDLRPSVTASQLAKTLFPVAEDSREALRPNMELSRGPAATIYAKSAPAIVMIQAGEGSFGTGFLIRPDGWIVTNHHVIKDSYFGVTSGARMVKVRLGRLREGIMSLDEPALVARVHKTDERQDLALLKLSAAPKSGTALPHLALARQGATAGDECIAIGHPARGMLWTLRRGEVSSVGRMPQDMADAVIEVLASRSKEEAAKLTDIFKSLPSRKVLLSTCGINMGDSGGPLLNSDGEVIGVTFGGPTNLLDRGRVLDKFGYHVHLDELRGFLREFPAEPPPFVPDTLPPATLSKFIDVSGNKVLDTMEFYVVVDPKKPPVPSGYQIDLAEETSPKFDGDKFNDDRNRALWRFQFAFHGTRVNRAFYDTDRGGRINVILNDWQGDGQADLALRLEGNTWKATPLKAQKMFDPALFEDATIREQFARLLPKLMPKYAPKATAPKTTSDGAPKTKE